MLEKQLAWCLALNRNSVVGGCYGDADDRRGRQEREKEKGKNRWKRKKRKGNLSIPLLVYNIFTAECLSCLILLYVPSILEASINYY